MDLQFRLSLIFETLDFFNVSNIFLIVYVFSNTEIVGTVYLVKGYSKNFARNIISALIAQSSF